MAKVNILTSEMLLLVFFIGLFIGIPTVETLEGAIDQKSRNSYNTCGKGVENEPPLDNPIPRLEYIINDIGISLDLTGDGDTNDILKDNDDWRYIKNQLDENLIHVDPWS